MTDRTLNDRSRPPTRPEEGRADLERDAYIELASTTDVLQRRFAAVLKPFDLTLAQFNVLRALALADEPVPVGYVADAMLTQTPDMTRLLDRLQGRELLTRVVSSADRRSVTVALTRAGRSLHVRAGRAVDDEHRRQWSALEDRDIARLLSSLRRVRADLTDTPTPNTAKGRS